MSAAKPRVWLVLGTVWLWRDHVAWPVRAFADWRAARAFAKRCAADSVAVGESCGAKRLKYDRVATENVPPGGFRYHVVAVDFEKGGERG